MVVLDVFIGLVLIYFLFSLFVSILAELLSTWIGMRARILRQGIDNFLNDKQPKKHGILTYLKDIFMVEPASFRFSNAGKFYFEPGIKYLAKVGENKWWSLRNTKPSYIEKSHFISATVSMLMRRSIGVNEWDKVKFAIEKNTLNLEPETLQMFKDWLTQSNDSYVKFKAYIGNSFEEVNDRLVGWYKRKIGLFLFIIGFIVCAIMNVDTFEIVQILSKNPDARMELAELAATTVQEDNAAKKIVKDELKATQNSIEQVGNILGRGWKTTEPWYPWNKKFWGFIITAFALSMGSKFWFDLLKRLVSLRGTGEKPDEHDINKIQTDPDIKQADNGLKLNTSDPAVIALSENRNAWEAQPGFIAANVKYTDSNVGYIELIFEKGRKIQDMPKDLPNPVNKDLPAIKLEYKIGKKGSFFENEDETDPKPPRDPVAGSLIHSVTNLWGTPAGIAFDPRSNTDVILTAGHVVRNDKTAFIEKSKSTVFYKPAADKEKVEIGNASNLVLSSFCDAGIIQLKRGLTMSFPNLPKLNNLRDVTFKDENKTNVTIHTLEKDVKAKIISTRESFAFDDFPASDIRFYDLFMMQEPKGDTSVVLTEAGDSGALITDDKNRQIGILIGAAKIDDENFSFGIKLKDIFDILQLEPPKNETKTLTT